MRVYRPRSPRQNLQVSQPYMMPFFNTALGGPMIIEIPPANGGSITGSIMDAWQTPLEDVGPAGVDAGKGGKYLILPPDYRDRVPDGYLPLPCQTYQRYALLRSILKSGSPEDFTKAIEYGKRIKFYPLSTAVNPPATIWLKATGRQRIKLGSNQSRWRLRSAFSFYGPEKTLFEKKWKLPVIE